MRWAVVMGTAVAAAALALAAQAQEAPPADPTLVESPIRPIDPTTGPLVQGIRVVPVVEDLEAPWSMVWLPNGDMLVTELLGQLRAIRAGLVVYTGDIYPDWRGDVFAGGRRVNRNDNPGALFHIDLDEAGAIIGQQRINFGDSRVRDVRQGPDGYLYVLTASTQNYRDAGHRNGVLWRLEPEG